MSNVTGIVKAIAQRGKAFNINVDEVWYGFGFEKPEFEKGAKVAFDVKMNGRYANVDNSTFQVVEAGAPDKAAPSGGGSSGMNSTQKSISWQSSRNAAITAANFAVEQGLAKVGTTQAKKLDTYLALIDNVTERFYADLEQLDATGEAPTQAASADSGDELDYEGDE